MVEGTVEKETAVYDSTACKRSRFAYLFECGFEYFVTLLVTDSFLAYLLEKLGMSESLIGIVSSLISLAFLFELFTVFVVGKIKNTKRFAILFHTASNLLFLSLFFIPFLPISASLRVPVSIVCILAAYFGNYFVTSMIYNWGNSFVNPGKRAEFSSVKEMVSLLGGLVLSIAFGFISGCYQKADNPGGWFLFSAGAVLIFAVCDFICLMLIQPQTSAADQAKAPQTDLKSAMHHTLGNKSFVYVVLLCCLWKFAMYFSIGFMGTYKKMLFGLALTQIINNVGTLARFAFSKPIGRFSDKYSYAKGISLGLIFAAIAFGINIFSAPGAITKWFVVIYVAFYSLCQAATNQNLLNISYNYVPKEYFVQASAVKNSLSGLVGFGASLLAGRLMTAIQDSGNTFFGLPVYGQQVLSACSFILVLICLIFNKLVIQKQKTIGR